VFEVGFWELVLVGVIGLIVIGPERLPGVVRVTGFWLGKARRTIATVKQEIRDELYAEDLRRQISKSLPEDEIRSLIHETSEFLNDTVNIDTVRSSGSSAKTGLNDQRLQKD
jgi:sec-independent protein translocase protein TatB